MKVVLIGTGNVATVLGRLFEASGHSIEQVYGRNSDTATTLAKQFNCAWVTDPALIITHSDLYLVAVSDNAIEEVCSQLHLGSQLTVHTAGSVSKEVLKNVSFEYGVFYPLQSLRSLAAKPGQIPEVAQILPIWQPARRLGILDVVLK